MNVLLDNFALFREGFCVTVAAHRCSPRLLALVLGVALAGIRV